MDAMHTHLSMWPLTSSQLLHLRSTTEILTLPSTGGVQRVASRCPTEHSRVVGTHVLFTVFSCLKEAKTCGRENKSLATQVPQVLPIVLTQEGAWGGGFPGSLHLAAI